MDGYGITEIVTEMMNLAQPSGKFSPQGERLVLIPVRLLDEAALNLGLVEAPAKPEA